MLVSENILCDKKLIDYKEMFVLYSIERLYSEQMISNKTTNALPRF